MSGISRAYPLPRKWQLITSSYTAKTNDLLLLNMNALDTITLPSNPNNGDEISMVQTSSSPVMININFASQNFQSTTATAIQYNNLNLDTLVYVNSTIGWISVNRLIHS